MENNYQTKLGQDQMENIYSFIPNGEFYFTKGVQAFQRNDLQNAKKYLQRAVELEPEEPIILCQYAIVLAELEQYDQSNDLFYRVLNNIDPNLHECHYFLANNFAYMGLYKKALYHANKYIHLEPEGEFAKDTLELIEIVSFEEDGMDEGVVGMEEYEDEEIIVGLDEARKLLESGEYEEAIGNFRRIINAYPEFWPAYNNLAIAYYFIGERELAKEMTEKVLSENPGNLHALCNSIVFQYYEGEDYKKLLPALEKIHPISVDHRYKLGVTFSILGEYEKGYRWLRKVLKHIPATDGSFYYWYSCAAYFVGKERQAKIAWEKLLRHHPDKAETEPWNIEKRKRREMEKDPL